MSDMAEVPQGSGIAGTDFDPYAGQQNTDDFYPNPLLSLLALIQWIASLCGWKISITSYAPFHNYYQWHIFQNALKAGWNEGFVTKGIVPAIPDCPILWQDVLHYWNFGGFTGTVAYEVAANIRFILALVLMLIAQQTTHMSTGQIAVVLLQQIGITV